MHVQSNMPTVTMTNELKHYVESLRSFLDRNPESQTQQVAATNTGIPEDECERDTGNLDKRDIDETIPSYDSIVEEK